MRRLAIMAATVLLLSGCTSGSDGGSGGGSDGDGSGSGETAAPPAASESTPTPTGPSCDDVWKAGETLPDDYEQCTVDGEFGSQEVVPCEDGSRLVTYDDALYAVTGQKIQDSDVSPLQDTEEYGAVFSACTGEE